MGAAEVAVGVLLLLLGLLATASGALKRRARVRALMGRSPLAVVEMTLGALTVVGSGVGLSRLRPLAWTVAGGVVGTMLLASTLHVRTSLRLRRRRDATEGARLERYVASVSPITDGFPDEKTETSA